MAGLAASLKAQPGLDITVVQENSPAVSQYLDKFAPSIIVFDLVQLPPKFVLSLLRNRSDLLLIGIDPSSDKLLVLSGHTSRAVTSADLVSVIETWHGSISSRPSRISFERLFGFLGTPVASLRARPRGQKLALAFAATGICLTLVLALALINPTANASLSGTAVGGAGAEVGWAFDGGVLLGGLLVWLVVRYGPQVWRKTR
jgi:hypothetical protein